jgi:hypothetical protein
MGCNASQNNQNKNSNNPNYIEKSKSSNIMKIGPIRNIKVIYKLDGEVFSETEFPSNTFIDIIVNDALQNVNSHKNFQKNSILNIFFETRNLRELINNKISDLVLQEKDLMEVELKSVGLSLPIDINAEYAKTNLIGRPLLDPFEIVKFDIRNSLITIDSYSNMDERVNLFNSLSSFCNGADKIFISGGENVVNGTKKILKEFCIVDLLNKSIQFFEEGLKFPRKWHSMIYVPNNYVFIVGGEKMLKVEYFDIEKNKMIEHSELNEERIEPSLCLIDNSSVYAFSGFKYLKNNHKTFERINLRNNSTKWEIINVKLDSSIKSFGQLFFGVTYYKENSVIFLGGTDSEAKDLRSNKNYAFDYVKNEIYLTDLPRVDFEFTEKFFIPIGRNTSFIFPSFTHVEDIKLLVWNDLKLKEIGFTAERKSHH